MNTAPLSMPSGPEAVSGVAPRFAVAPSAGLRRIRHLARFLDVEAVLSPREARRRGTAGDVVLVWGRKRTALRAERYARERGLPVWYLEDGWIRSTSENAHSPTCYSLLVDPVGVYYDSATPSAIESFLNRPDEAVARDLDVDALMRARVCRRRIVDGDITKYNWCPGHVAREAAADDRPLVLVVDQTRDDASVSCGALVAEDFVRMLDAALEENPGARVLVRTHPDVVSGRRLGYLTEAARERGVALSAAGDNPLPWLKRAARVYVGTSQLGYEALLCERPVIVFGQPFYAGWGLTEDRAPIPRRVHARSLDELFHAAHVHLARYCSPMDGAPWSLERCLDHVELQKSEFERNARRFLCLGITPWKRRYVARFLRSPDGEVRFGRAEEARPDDTPLCWSFRAPDDVAPTEATAAPWRMEDGFLRSVGLGSDFTAPGSLVVDSGGLYFDARGPSELEHLLEHRDCTPAETLRAVRLRRSILAAGLSKYNVGRRAQLRPRLADRIHVLVIGQVEGDESLRLGSPDVRTNTALLQAVRKARPEAWITYRPHPDVQAGNRDGEIDRFTLDACADAVDVDSTVGDCIEACDELHTMTSLAGFEGLMRDKDVTTWGAPFYAGWGLTNDHLEVPRRTRRRTLDELVFMTLIAYPRYIDIDSGEFTTPEETVRSIARARDEGVSSVVPRRLKQVLNIVRGLRYAP